MSSVRTLHWNGTDFPDELRSLPAGTYVVESVDSSSPLTSEEEAGLEAALASLRAGKGRTLEQVRQTIDVALRR